MRHPVETIEELKAFREELAERRLVEVFRLTAYQDDRLAVVAHIQASLDAIDAVIAKGDLPPDAGEPLAFFIG